MSKQRFWRLLAVFFALSLFAGACGDDDTSTDDTSTDDTSTDDTSTDDTSTDGPDDAGDRAGETIKVGLVNNEGGVVSLPEFRIGAEVAIEYINATGGIDGATIETVVCKSDASPEGAIDCANQMIEANVVLSYTGIDVASDAALPLYQEAGIPYVSSNGWGTVQANADGSTILHTASDAYAVGPMQVMQDLGLTKVSTFFAPIPSAEVWIETVVRPIAANMELELDEINIDAASADWTAAIAAAQTNGAEMIWAQATEPDCIGMVTAARSSGYDGEIFAGSCSAFIDVLGDDAIGVYTQGDLYFPSTASFASPEIAARLATYETLMADAGHADKAEGFAVASFGAWMELRAILESVDGAITAEAVQTTFDAGNVSEGWFGADLRCGQEPWPTAKSNCMSDIAIWKVAELDDGTIGRTLYKDFFDAFEASGL